MFVPEWCLWCILLTVHGSAQALEISEYDGDAVICSQGLSHCKEENVIFGENSDLAVQKLKPDFKLCCKNNTECELCLVIEVEIDIPVDGDVENEGQSGDDEEADKEEAMNDKTASVTVCYRVHERLHPCKKVEFTVNHTALAQQNLTKVSMVITWSNRFAFGNQVTVYTLKEASLKEKLVAPSLDEVCSQKQLKHIPECKVPRLKVNVNQTTNQLELQFVGKNKHRPSLCVQYEEKGVCQLLNRTTIPLSSAAPCMCFQAWYENKPVSRQVLYCPFKGKDCPPELQQNVWKNVSVEVRLSNMNDKALMLLWNLSAPCRLEGEVQLCYKSVCRGLNDLRQNLSGGTWKQNRKGFWERQGAFEDINEQLSQCVMVKTNKREFGPFCSSDSGRWRWSLLVVGVMLLFCLTALMIYFLRDFVKKWVWSWRHGGFVKLGRKGHMVLLGPPDVDVAVSESICQLGSLLCSRGFSVSVDQWSRKEQCAQGPLPWLHSQMLKLDSTGGRVLLFLSTKTSERTEEWSDLNRAGDGETLQQLTSPYSDLFTASLFLIHCHKKLGRAAERFVLVKLDSNQKQSHRSDKSLPELLQGLPLFQLPSQTQALLDELTVVETKMGPGRRTWMRWR